MAKSKAMERLFNNLTIKSYDDREELLKQAKKEGFNCRQGTYAERPPDPLFQRG